ncbi:MAG: phosphoenolpyruvate--protein phosphotransferase, partial [Oscillospiraceae bacterium]
MIYRGYPVSPGIAIGKVFVYQPFEAVVNETQFPEEKTKEYMGRFHEICDEAEKELIGIEEFLNKKDPDKAKIFKAHQDILSDVAIVEDIEDAINCDHLMPDFSIDMVFKKYIKVLEKAKDPLIAERTADLRDVRNRLLRIWCGVQEKNLSNLPGPVIIVARDLLPSDTATLDRENVIGIATEVGGSTSHSAIIAKSYEIPAVLGICNLLGTVIDGEEVVLDACDGFLYTDATESELHDFENKRKVFLDDVHEVKEYLFREPLTADGVHIDIGLNIGSPNPEELANNECSDMVGLFRTEFLYMGSMRLPTEDEQFTAYKTVLSKYGERPVTLRTLDIGGDKTLSYMELPREDNPFLGNRALRLCFDNIPIFKTQLRAAYRASVFGNLWLMMPMVGSLDDIRGAKKIIEEVKAELTAEGIEYKKDVKVGIM